MSNETIFLPQRGTIGDLIELHLRTKQSEYPCMWEPLYRVEEFNFIEENVHCDNCTERCEHYQPCFWSVGKGKLVVEPIIEKTKTKGGMAVLEEIGAT